MIIPGDRVKMGCSVTKDLVAETGLLSKYTPMQLRTRVSIGAKKRISGMKNRDDVGDVNITE